MRKTDPFIINQWVTYILNSNIRIFYKINKKLIETFEK